VPNLRLSGCEDDVTIAKYMSLGPQDVPRCAQEGAKWSHDGFKMRHTGPKMGQDGAKTEQNRSRMASKMVQM
jgi:hypothetical protein